MKEDRAKKLKELEQRFAQMWKWDGHQEQYELMRAGNCMWISECGNCVLSLPEHHKPCAECWQDCPLSKERIDHAETNQIHPD